MADMKGKKVAWGIPAKAVYGTAITQSYNEGKGAKTKEILDEEGETVALAVYDANTSVNFTAVLVVNDGGSVTVPAIGDEITFDEKKILVSGCDTAWNNEDAAKVTIQGRTYSKITTTTGS